MKKYLKINGLKSFWVLGILMALLVGNMNSANAGEIVAARCEMNLEGYAISCSSDIPSINERIRYNESWLVQNGVAQYNPADGKPAEVYGFPVNKEDSKMAGISGNGLLSVYRNKNNKANAKFTTGPVNGPKIVRTTVEVDYSNNAEPTGWNLNIGDSIGNNGWGGDFGERENDAEITLNAKFFQVFGNDFTPANIAIDGHRKLYETNLGSMKGEHVLFEVKDNFVSWNFKNNSSKNGSMVSPYLYALNGQKDAGGTDSNIWVDFNNTLLDYDRNGTGVVAGVITMYTTSEEVTAYDNKLKEEEKLKQEAEAKERAAKMPVVITKDATNVEAKKAVINGSYTNIWLEKISSTDFYTWFHYGTDQNNLGTERVGYKQELVTTRASVGNGSVSIGNLVPNTTYYFKYCGAGINMLKDVTCGEVKSFTTSGNELVVITNDPHQYSPENYAVRLSGTYKNIYVNNKTDFSTWFHLGTDPNNLPTIKIGSYTHVLDSSPTTQNQNRIAEGIKKDTTYYYKTCASGVNGTTTVKCGEVKTFSTFGGVLTFDAKKPEVKVESFKSNTLTVNNITINSATVYGSIDSSLTSTYDANFIYGTTSGALDKNTPYASVPVGFSSPGAVVSNVSAGNSTTLTGLTPDTTYFFKFCANDVSSKAGGGVKCGVEMSFKTLPTPNFTVTTNPVTEITYNSAKFNSTYNNVYHSDFATMFMFGPGKGDTEFLLTPEVRSSHDNLPANWSEDTVMPNLSPDTTYLVKACGRKYVDGVVNFTCGEIVEFTTPALPGFTVTTNPVTEITHNSAKFNWEAGNIYLNDFRSGFLYGVSTSNLQGPAGTASKHTKFPSAWSGNYKASNLTPDTIYYVKAWGIDDKPTNTEIPLLTTEGDIVSFKTLPAPIFTATTIAATDITTNSAVLNSKIEGLYGKSATLNFQVSPDSNFRPSYGYIPTETKTLTDYKNPEEVSYDTQIKDLNYGRTYYFKICAKNDLGQSACGKTLSFITPTPTNMNLKATTEGASSITTDSAILYGYANNIYDYTYKGRFEYGTSTTLGVNTNYVGVRILKQPEEVFQNSNITGLTPNTTYYYHYCGSGMANTPSAYVCGETKTFKTLAVEIKKDFSVTTIGAKVLDKNSATLIGNMSTTYTNKFDAYFEYGLTTTFGTKANAFADTQIEADATKESEVTIANLEPNTNYSYRACAKTQGGLFGLGATTKCGEIKTFKTPEDFGQLCRIETYTAAYNKYWDIDETQFNFKKLHPEIEAYRIKWWNNAGWSEWFTPTVNDVDPKNPVQNQSDYFQDHTHQVKICGDNKYKPQGDSVLISSELAEQKPSITVLTPNGGEDYTSAGIININWETVNIHEDAKFKVEIWDKNVKGRPVWDVLTQPTDFAVPDVVKTSSIGNKNTYSTIFHRIGGYGMEDENGKTISYDFDGDKYTIKVSSIIKDSKSESTIVDESNNSFSMIAHPADTVEKTTSEAVSTENSTTTSQTQTSTPAQIVQESQSIVKELEKTEEKLEVGDTGKAVEAVQKALDLPADGNFGKATAQAVKEFQQENNLIPDGVIGAKTLDALVNEVKTEASNEIAVTTDNSNGTISVLTPNGSEVYNPGQTITVTWDYANISSNTKVNISMLEQGNTNAVYVSIGSAMISDKSFTTVIPNDVAIGKYKLAVGSLSNDMQWDLALDWSDDSFIIKEIPAPNLADKLKNLFQKTLPEKDSVAETEKVTTTTPTTITPEDGDGVSEVVEDEVVIINPVPAQNLSERINRLREALRRFTNIRSNQSATNTNLVPQTATNVADTEVQTEVQNEPANVEIPVAETQPIKSQTSTPTVNTTTVAPKATAPRIVPVTPTPVKTVTTPTKPTTTLPTRVINTAPSTPISAPTPTITPTTTVPTTNVKLDDFVVETPNLTPAEATIIEVLDAFSRWIGRLRR